MIDPLSINVSLLKPAQPPASQAADTVGKGEFAGLLREQLERVNQVQSEADEGLKRVLTGESQNLTEVFVTARKAEVSFIVMLEF